jgi:hypothetical protein
MGISVLLIGVLPDAQAKSQNAHKHPKTIDTMWLARMQTVWFRVLLSGFGDR